MPVTLRKGQPLYLAESPVGLAQVDDFGRTNVVIGWRVHGRWRTRRVPARRAVAMAAALLFPLADNPFDRACRPKVKTFTA